MSNLINFVPTGANKIHLFESDAVQKWIDDRNPQDEEHKLYSISYYAGGIGGIFNAGDDWFVIYEPVLHFHFAWVTNPCTDGYFLYWILLYLLNIQPIVVKFEKPLVAVKFMEMAPTDGYAPWEEVEREKLFFKG